MTGEQMAEGTFAGETQRVIIEHVTPEVDNGRYAVKRLAGETVHVEADIFCDGHEELRAFILYKRAEETEWKHEPLTLQWNDHWYGDFTLEEPGSYVYKIEAWIDRFGTWLRDLQKRVEAGQDVAIELQVGSALMKQALRGLTGDDFERLNQRADALTRPDWPQLARVGIAFEVVSSELMALHGPRDPLTTYDVGQHITVDRAKAGFSAWYEVFPRSTAPAGQVGTFKTTMDWLPYISGMGFDVLYFPPIHPIGEINRKGANNAEKGEEWEPGSPWAIGSAEGGHTTVNPDLGTLDDFKALVAAAQQHGMEIALDIAYQCAPDHPWVKQHPEWFKHRPDGSIRYAENPPKLYQDIYPIDFETRDRAGLWKALEDVVRFWVEQGVRIFRVDNPHTKAFAFWQYMIANVKRDFPDVLFLAEAFTRPRTMEHLAKLGFSQSYTYFTWRNTKWELATYMDELTNTDIREYFRPNFWPNTPDILHESLQDGGRPAFVSRFMLAATLSSNYGIYGPAFELCVNQPRENGSEEYLNSEKYEVKHWDLDQSHSLRDYITLINKARRENTALQYTNNVRFLDPDGEHVLSYYKISPDGTNRILVMVNLDYSAGHSAAFWLPLEDMGLSRGEEFYVDDLLKGTTETWRGDRQMINLHPGDTQVRLLRLRTWQEANSGS